MSDILKPEIYCPLVKDGREIPKDIKPSLESGENVPIWYCLGSFMQGRPACEHLEEATVKISENFCEVKCGPRSEMDAEEASA